MLTVIVIIGILAGLITAAAIHARTAAKAAAARTEIGQLQQALEKYKQDNNEYPPDFAFGDPLLRINPQLRSVRRQAVLRHLQTAFPRYFETLPANNPPDPETSRWTAFQNTLSTNYNGLDPDTFDHASALVFWLGGLPAQVPAAGQPWIPAGFNADKANPFTQTAAGAPRTEPYFTFAPDRLVPFDQQVDGFARPLRFYPTYCNGHSDQGARTPVGAEAPYVYFRARRDATSGRFEYGFSQSATVFRVFSYRHMGAAGQSGVSLPYMNGPNVDALAWSNPLKLRPWCDEQKFQIITAGMQDNDFGNAQASLDDLRNLMTGEGISALDFDNITSVAPGRLEDAMPK
jgi:type II secretory pathway pseudopilin PulG